MSSANKTTIAGLNQWQGNEYPKREDFNSDNANVDALLGNTSVFETAGGTATAITLTGVTLKTGYSKNFIVNTNNNGAATTVNGKPLYLSGGTSTPNLVAGKVATIYYNEEKTCFYLSAQSLMDNLGDLTIGSRAAGTVGINSTAEGINNLASGLQTHAEGYGCTASGNQAHAEGDTTAASGGQSHAEGKNNIASGGASHAEGNSNIAYGIGAHAEGGGTRAYSHGAHSEGAATHAGGSDTDPTVGQHAHAEGESTTASGVDSHAEGYLSIANGSQSHAEGESTTANATGSHAEGRLTTADGSNSHVEGNATQATADSAHAEGNGTKASGNSSHAEGKSTVASGERSHAEGTESAASGINSHAEGCETTASLNQSHAEGYHTTASGDSSHAEGTESAASGINSHAEGCETTASLNQSHAEGYHTTASGDSSHAEGVNAVASGSYSHAEGNNTTASGISAHAGGVGTKANSSAQSAIGRYNDNQSDTLFEVGNGTSDAARSNAISVYADGRVEAGAFIGCGYIQPAGGSATAITLNYVQLIDGYSITFSAMSSNGGAATTINGKPLYKVGGTSAPTLLAGHMYTVRYNGSSSCFFLKASAEGTAVAGDVLAGNTFSNDSDTGISGTMVNRGAVTIVPGASTQAILQGYHNGSGSVSGDSNLVSGNILSGIPIFNVTGSAKRVQTGTVQCGGFRYDTLIPGWNVNKVVYHSGGASGDVDSAGRTYCAIIWYDRAINATTVFCLCYSWCVNDMWSTNGSGSYKLHFGSKALVNGDTQVDTSVCLPNMAEFGCMPLTNSSYTSNWMNYILTE